MSGAELEQDATNATSTAAGAATDPRREPYDLGLDQLFEVLQNQRRRYVLQYLHDNEGGTSLSNLSEQIAAWENDKEIRRISSSERKRVYVALYQCHLPKMDDMGVVEFEQARGTIEAGEHIQLCYSYLDVHENSDERRRRYYAALAVVAAAGLLIGTGVQTVLSIPAISVGTGMAVLAFAMTSVWSYRPRTSDDD